jgi:hypothetical protein
MTFEKPYVPLPVLSCAKAVTWGLSSERVRRARVVLRQSRPLAEYVISGRLSLDAALVEASAAKPAPVNPAFDMQQGDSDLTFYLEEITRRIAQMGDPARVARDIPVRHRHVFSRLYFARVAEWFSRLADGWDNEAG